MLKTYRIIPFVFILCLFGLTLITVSPVFAEDSQDFKACQKTKGIKGEKNCLKNLARDLEASENEADENRCVIVYSDGSHSIDTPSESHLCYALKKLCTTSKKRGYLTGTSNGKYPLGKDIFHDAVNELCY
jgi:hypothetical protein